MKPRRFFLFPLLLALASFSGHAASPFPLEDPPPLTVIIVVDQMRHDYLTRFSRFFLPAREGGTIGGFRYLLEEGAVFTNARYRSLPAHTAVGHAIIASGAPPYKSGIVGNKWYNRTAGRDEYCVMDPAHESVIPRGSGEDPGTSPRNLRASTIADELKQATGGEARVVALALKERSAILLGGHHADRVLWFSTQAGLWTTSSYYAPDRTLPPWVSRFNQAGPADRYFGRPWTLLLPEDAYAWARRTRLPSEGPTKGYEAFGESFPHNPSLHLGAPGSKFYTALSYSPFGNDLTVDLALEALKEERLGQRGVPDFLAVSFSSNDLVGHLFGPTSREVQDTTIRTDRALSRLLSALDRQVPGGLARVLLVLTSDHGTMDLPEALVREGLSGGRVKRSALKERVTNELTAAFGPGQWVLSFQEPHLYLNHALLAEKRIPIEEAEQRAAATARALPGIAWVFTRTQIMEGRLPVHAVGKMVARSYDPERGGDVVVIPHQHWNWFEGQHGTMHGLPYAYDLHVPLILHGPGIRKGWHHTSASPEDIAPTLATILGIEQPSGSEGRVLHEALR